MAPLLVFYSIFSRKHVLSFSYNNSLNDTHRMVIHYDVFCCQYFSIFLTIYHNWIFSLNYCLSCLNCVSKCMAKSTLLKNLLCVSIMCFRLYNTMIYSNFLYHSMRYIQYYIYKSYLISCVYSTNHRIQCMVNLCKLGAENYYIQGKSQ